MQPILRKSKRQKRFWAIGWPDTHAIRSNTKADLKFNPKTIAIIQEKVDPGLFTDADDVVCAAL